MAYCTLGIQVLFFFKKMVLILKSTQVASVWCCFKDVVEVSKYHYKTITMIMHKASKLTAYIKVD